MLGVKREYRILEIQNLAFEIFSVLLLQTILLLTCFLSLFSKDLFFEVIVVDTIPIFWYLMISRISEHVLNFMPLVSASSVACPATCASSTPVGQRVGAGRQGRHALDCVFPFECLCACIRRLQLRHCPARTGGGRPSPIPGS